MTITSIPSVPFVIEKKQNNFVLCSQNSIYNDVSISNNNDIQSCETPIKENYSIPTTSTRNHHAQRIDTIYTSILNLHRTMRLPSVGKVYVFHNDSKTGQAVKCIKSRIITKAIDYFLYIYTFEQQYVVIKCMLQ